MPIQSKFIDLKSTRLMACVLICLSFTLQASAIPDGGKKTKAERKEARMARKAKREAAREARERAMLEDADYMEEDNRMSSRSSKTRSRTRREPTPRTRSNPPTRSNAESDRMSTSMEDYALSLQGIPYRYGGTDKKGFDCSGYVKHVFDKEGVFVPRTAQAQYETSDPISQRKAAKGDLVFFGKNRTLISHVGILISSADEPLRMIHSSSSKGIIITEVESDSYWRPKLIGIGRVSR